MLEVASKYNEITQGDDVQIIKKDGKLNIDISLMDDVQKESSLVGMLMAWSVVALESLINHAIAENLNNKMVAILAIEHPGQITGKIKKGISAKSELAKKLVVLDDDRTDISALLKTADSLADLRNYIVHDKPFDLVTDDEGEVDIEHYKVRGIEMEKRIRFKNLMPFFKDCDQIKEFVEKNSNLDHLNTSEKSFCGLVNG
ncbi:hypothetical protein ACG1BZ_09745 [Microbulbifer sp. CNSA002]|uniref:hypothetical protein n=1 Tax=unclassified Microbulbifer TaxID=2619833 RepID=UPI0039B549D6